MASTLTVAVTYKQRLYVASVGDSRAYHYSPTKGLRLLTQDYTTSSRPEPINLVDTSSKRHQHYLGQNYRIIIDIVQCEIEADDILLLCTDGLWHMIADDRIQEILSQGGDPQKLAATLVAAANHAGGDGNISAIAARVQ